MTLEEFDADVKKVALSFVDDYIRMRLSQGATSEIIKAEIGPVWEEFCK